MQHPEPDPTPVPMQCAQSILPVHNDDDENSLVGQFFANDLYHPDGSVTSTD